MKGLSQKPRFFRPSVLQSLQQWKLLPLKQGRPDWKGSTYREREHRFQELVHPGGKGDLFDLWRQVTTELLQIPGIMALREKVSDWSRIWMWKACRIWNGRKTILRRSDFSSYSVDGRTEPAVDLTRKMKKDWSWGQQCMGAFTHEKQFQIYLCQRV